MGAKINLRVKCNDLSADYFEGEFQIDYGVEFLVMPFSELDKLGVKPNDKLPFPEWVLPNGHKIIRRGGRVVIESNGRTSEVEVVFGEVDDCQIIGAKLLTSLGLFCHPLNQQVLPLPRLLQPRRFGELNGIKEQYQRAMWFLRIAQNASEVTARLRLLIAGVYAGRAVIEQIIGNLSDNYLSTSVETFIKSHTRHYQLIADARKQDFHRNSFEVSDRSFHYMVGGPVELKTAPEKGATAAMVGGPNGMEPVLSPGSTMQMVSKHDKHTPQPIQFFNNNGNLYVRGGDSNTPMAFADVLQEYLCDLPEAVDAAIEAKVIPNLFLSSECE